ncbi:MAG: hypothetical protein JRN68_11280 [Nitrososphaerota archaeon]|nr:hypothetical protein [Nitrososphaerota archaeon]
MAGGLVTEGYVTIVEAPLAATVGAAIGAHLQSQLCGYYSAAGQAAASRVR